MKKIISKYFLLLILLLAAVLRIWHLGSNPPHLTPDEAALGYNAYSILKTGKDEYGKFLPIIFKSFGDFKPGLYVYATVPFVAALGLNEFSVRLPSALGGVLAVFLVYKILSLLVDKDSKYQKTFPMLSSLMLAISPWHIHFSRGAWEVNLALTLTLFGIYYFLKAKEKALNIVFSATFFALTLITYQGAKLSSLIVLVLLFLTNFKEIKDWLANKEFRKKILLAAALGVMIAAPTLLSFTRGQTGRLKVFSVFSYQRPQEYLDEQLSLAKVEFGTPKYYLYYSESLNTARGIMGRWFNHFSGRFLFFEGDWQNPRHSSPDMGEMLLADMLFLALGILGMAKVKSKWSRFILGWLILAPLPAALSRDQVHAVRSINMVIPLTMLTAYGVINLWSNLRLVGKLAFWGFASVAYLGSFVYFLDSYFVHQPVHNSQFWEYGYKQVVEAVAPIQNNYKTVHVRQSYAQPYIYFLFYGGAASSAYQTVPYDPAKYQSQANLIESEYGDVGRVEHLGNISFLPIDWTVNRGDFGTLFVADPIRIPPDDSNDPKEFTVIDEIKYLDGKETAFRLIEVLNKNEE